MRDLPVKSATCIGPASSTVINAGADGNEDDFLTGVTPPFRARGFALGWKAPCLTTA